MQSSTRVVVSLVLLSSALASFDSSTKLRRDGGFSNKLRRDGVLNLYPFPRVGRAKNTWQVPLSDFFMGRAVDFEPIEKRQLYAFPRVGRGDPSMREQGLSQHHRDFQMAPVKRTSGDNPGMWFGPRLGRSFMSDDDVVPASKTSGDKSGLWFGPRLGRSYKSDDDDITIENDTSHSEPEQMEAIHEDRATRDANLI